MTINSYCSGRIFIRATVTFKNRSFIDRLKIFVKIERQTILCPFVESLQILHRPLACNFHLNPFVRMSDRKRYEERDSCPTILITHSSTLQFSRSILKQMIFNVHFSCTNTMKYVTIAPST